MKSYKVQFRIKDGAISARGELWFNALSLNKAYDQANRWLECLGAPDSARDPQMISIAEGAGQD